MGFAAQPLRNGGVEKLTCSIRERECMGLNKVFNYR